MQIVFAHDLPLQANSSPPPRELEQRRRRRQGRPLVENEFIFYQRNSRLSKSVLYANSSKIVLSWPNMQLHRPISNGNIKN